MYWLPTGDVTVIVLVSLVLLQLISKTGLAGKGW